MTGKFKLTYIFIILSIVVITACSGGGGGGSGGITSKAWGAATQLEADTGHSLRPQIAFDANNNALAVWSQSDGTRYNIWARRYTTGTGWDSATLIESDNAGSANDPQITFDASGNALAIWSQSDGTRYNIWVNRYTAGSGWGTSTIIETVSAGDSLQPKIALDSNGNALAVWYKSDGTNFNIWSNRYTPSIGWGSASLIESNNTGSAYNPQIVFDANGNALAIWYQSDGINDNIWSNRYRAGTGWGTAALIETNNNGIFMNPSFPPYPQIAIDANGNALAVWSQFDGTRDNIWSNRYTAGTGWGTAELIETNNAGSASYPMFPQIAIDANGNALAVWSQFDGTRDNIWSNRYTAGTGWGTAGLIETANGEATEPQVAFDANGNALAVWYQTDGSRDYIWSNRYTIGTGWGGAVHIENNSAGNAHYPQIAIDANGNAMAVWAQFDGTRDDIWANRFQ